MAAGKQSGLRLIAGTAWMIGMRWSMRLAGLISTLILARLLAPEDFGIIAMAKVALGLLEALSTSGVELALIRTPDRSRDLYNTAWTIRLLQRAVMACILFLLAPLAVDYFDEPRTLAVIQLLAAATLLKGFTNIGTVDFRKDLNFSAEFRLGVLEKLVSVAIAIILAVVLRNYWALAIAIIADALVSAIFSYVLHPFRPRFSLSRWNELWRFSMWILATRVAFFANGRMDQILVGGTFSTTDMGYYNFGSELGTLPGDEVAEPFRRSVYPNLSTLIADHDAFARTTMTVFGVVALLLLPIGFGLAAVAPSFVPVVLGEKWIPAIPVLSIAALYGAIGGLTSILELPLLIIGKERVAAMIAWAQVVLLTPTVFFATQFGDLLYVAVARAAVVVVAFLLTVTAVAMTLGLAPMRLVSTTWRSLTASVIMFGVITHVADSVDWNNTVTLVSSICFGVLAFPALTFLLWIVSGRPEGPESQITQWLAKRFHSRNNVIN
jgi:lipopolysaccharide exporter